MSMTPLQASTYGIQYANGTTIMPVKTLTVRTVSSELDSKATEILRPGENHYRLGNKIEHIHRITSGDEAQFEMHLEDEEEPFVIQTEKVQNYQKMKIDQAEELEKDLEGCMNYNPEDDKDAE